MARRKNIGDNLRTFIRQYKIPTNCRFSFINKTNENLQKKTSSGINSLYERIFGFKPDIENDTLSRLTFLYSLDFVFDPYIRNKEFDLFVEYIDEKGDKIFSESYEKAKKLRNKYNYIYDAREKEIDLRKKPKKEQTNTNKKDSASNKKKTKKGRKRIVFDQNGAISILKQYVSSVTSNLLKDVIVFVIDNPEVINQHHNDVAKNIANKLNIKENTARTYFYKVRSIIKEKKL